MASMQIMENPKRRKKTRRRNPTATQIKPSKNPVAIKRRSVSLAAAKSVIAKNGLKAVSRVSNPRKRKTRKRRNGLTQPITRRANGILGNSKQDVKQTGSLLLGMAVTKGLGRVLQGFAAPFLAQIGVGKYSEIISDVAVALLIVPFGFGKIAGSEAAKFGRLGGLGVVGLDALNIVAPNVVNQYNPFVSAPIMLNAGGQAVMPVATAVELAKDVANSPNPPAAAAQLEGAMYGDGFAGSMNLNDTYLTANGVF